MRFCKTNILIYNDINTFFLLLLTVFFIIINKNKLHVYNKHYIHDINSYTLEGLYTNTDLYKLLLIVVGGSVPADDVRRMCRVKADLYSTRSLGCTCQI